MARRPGERYATQPVRRLLLWLHRGRCVRCGHHTYGRPYMARVVPAGAHNDPVTFVPLCRDCIGRWRKGKIPREELLAKRKTLGSVIQVNLGGQRP